MSLWLKQSTAKTIKIGPFLDDTDGKTAETGLSIAQADIRLSKNGGDIAQSNNSAGATHDESGYYDIPLDTTDTGTLGTLRVMISKSGALPVWQDFMVVPANIWDSFFGADYLETDVTQWKGATAPAMTGDAYARLGAPAGASVSADIAAVKAVLPAALVSGRIDASVGAVAAAAITSGAFAADALSASAFAQGAADKVWSTAARTLTDKTGFALADATSDAVIADAVWNALTASYGSANTYGALLETNLDAAMTTRAPAATALTNATWTDVRAGKLDNLDAAVTTRAAAATALSNAVWTDAKAGYLTGDSFVRLGAPVGASISADIAALPTAAENTDAVWDEALSGHTGAGTAGKALSDAGAAGDPWGTALPGAYGAGTAGYILGTNLNATVSSRATPASAADQVWDEAITDHLGAGSCGAALNAAGSAGDPWSTPIPGAYGAGTAGKIVGDNLNATVSSRAAAATALSNAVWTDAKAGYLTGDSYVRLGAPAGASVSADIAAVKAVLPAALVGGRIDASVGAVAAAAITSGAFAADALSASAFAQGAADKVWSTAARTLTDKTGFALADATSDAVIADAVWNALTASYGSANTYGALLETNLDAAMTTRAPAATALTNATWTDVRAGKLDNLDAAMTTRAAAATALSNAVWTDAKAGYLTGDSYVRLGAPVGASISADIAALPTAAEVNAEVLDVLSVDTWLQLPQAAPPASPTAVQMLMLNYMFLRNKVTTDTAQKLYGDDEATVVMKRSISDDGAIFTRGELGTGP